MEPRDLLARISLPRWLTRAVMDRLEIPAVLLQAYQLGLEDGRHGKPESRPLFFFLPGDGRELVSELCHTITMAERRGIVVSFLPPDRKIGHALEGARALLGDRVQIILDGTTQTSVGGGKAEMPWAERRALPERGAIHAKAVLVDDALWWGSWNLSRAAAKQVDIVERTTDPEIIRRAEAWVQTILLSTDPVDLTERARGPFQGSPEQAPMQGPSDPDLGF